MTVSSQTSRDDYLGNGVTIDHPVTFRFLANTHLRVLRTVIATNVTTVLILDSLGPDGFSVTGAGLPAGGNVRTVTPPAVGERLSILRDMPFTQLIDYISNDPFPAESHERGLDERTMENQQMLEVVGRAITLPPQTTGVSTDLPAPQALNLLRWNASETALENAVPPEIATVAPGAVVDATVSPIAAIQGTKLNYIQAGAGSINRDIQAKLRGLVLDAQDQGVVGDGITVCDTQLAAAIALVPDGCTLQLPRGTIKLNNTVTADNITIQGHGTGTILDFSGLSAAEDAIVFGASFTSPPTLRNLRIQMNGSGRDGLVFQGGDHPTTDEVHIYRPGRDGVVLEPAGAFLWIENTRFKNTKVIEPARDGLRMTLANHSNAFINLGVYDGFEVRDAARYVINVEQGHDLDSINQHTFIGCELEQNWNVPTAPAIFFNRTNAAHPLPFASQFVFINCTFEDLAFAHTASPIDSNVTGGVDDVTLINCIVFNYTASESVGAGVRRANITGAGADEVRGATPFNEVRHTGAAVNDSLGGLAFSGGTSTGARKRYGAVEGIIVDPTNGSEDAKIRTSAVFNGTRQPCLDVDFPLGVASDVGLIVAVNRAGTVTLSRVTIGAVDSGGAGFRVLRVPNA